MLHVAKFSDGYEYISASEVIELAQSMGYEPHISTDGRLHPGSMCNRFMHQVIMNQALRLHYNINRLSVVKITKESAGGYLDDYVKFSGLNKHSIVNGALDLYNWNAVKAILTVLLNVLDPDLSKVPRVYYKANPTVAYYPKTVERKKERSKVSLFGRK